MEREVAYLQTPVTWKTGDSRPKAHLLDDGGLTSQHHLPSQHRQGFV